MSKKKPVNKISPGGVEQTKVPETQPAVEKGPLSAIAFRGDYNTLADIAALLSVEGGGRVLAESWKAVAADQFAGLKRCILAECLYLSGSRELTPVREILAFLEGIPGASSHFRAILDKCMPSLTWFEIFGKVAGAELFARMLRVSLDVTREAMRPERWAAVKVALGEELYNRHILPVRESASGEVSR